MNQKLFLIIGLLLSVRGLSQKLTLQQAIDSALKNNTEVRQSKLRTDVAEISWQQSRLNQFPTVNGIINHGINQGRSIDPFTNTYVNQSINYAGYGVNTGVLLYNGSNLKNVARQQALAYEASKLELQQAKDEIILNVILAYLLVLNNEDQVASATRQAEVSRKQLERLEILDKKGAVVPSMVSDIKGQLMNDQLAIASFQNQLETARLNLAQQMNTRYTGNMEIDRMSIEQDLIPYAHNNSELVTKALQDYSLVKAAALRKQSSAYALKAAKGEKFPSLALNYNVQTNYSSVASNSLGKIPYNEQLGNNIFSTINLGIRVPIFNGKLTRNRIRLAEIEVKSTELAEERIQRQLEQQIDQAFINIKTAFDRYQLMQEQVKAYEASFNAAEARLNVGVGSTVDFLIAKTNLDRAKINLISGKYEFLLRKRILDFYYGK